jgi:hypothetical protein
VRFGSLSDSIPIRAFLDICWKNCFVCDLKDFDFIHCEILGAREEVPEGDVVRVHAVTSVSAKAYALVSIALQLAETQTQLTPNGGPHSELPVIA